MRDRDARVGGRRDSGGDARHHLKGNGGLGDRLGLLPAAAEHKGIAPFQAHHDLAGPCAVDHQPVDLGLIAVLPATPPADVDPLGLGPHMLQQRRVGEIIVDDHLGLLQAFLPAKGQQLRVPRPGAHQIDFADLHQALP